HGTVTIERGRRSACADLDRYLIGTITQQHSRTEVSKHIVDERRLIKHATKFDNITFAVELMARVPDDLESTLGTNGKVDVHRFANATLKSRRSTRAGVASFSRRGSNCIWRPIMPHLSVAERIPAARLPSVGPMLRL